MGLEVGQQVLIASQESHGCLPPSSSRWLQTTQQGLTRRRASYHECGQDFGKNMQDVTAAMRLCMQEYTVQMSAAHPLLFASLQPQTATGAQQQHARAAHTRLLSILGLFASWAFHTSASSDRSSSRGRSLFAHKTCQDHSRVAQSSNTLSATDIQLFAAVIRRAIMQSLPSPELRTQQIHLLVSSSANHISSGSWQH